MLSVLLPLTGFAQSSPAPSAHESAATAKPSDDRATSSPASSPAPDAAELTRLLKNFLAGASRNDVAMHDRFWADDLIYTGSTGRRIGKSQIMGEVRKEAAAPDASGETATYSATDVRIQQYGTTAIVAFQLVATTKKGDKIEINNYLNTGTFVKRDGEWKAVSWQATKMPGKPDTR